MVYNGISIEAELIGRFDRPEIFYSFTSPLQPATAYVYDAKEDTSRPFNPPKLTFDPARFESIRQTTVVLLRFVAAYCLFDAMNVVFVGATSPVPEELGDINCDGVYDVLDVVQFIDFLFASGKAPCM